MSLFGKILSILNCLAAVVFVCLLGLDYRASQAWSYASRVYQFRLNGLPLSQDDKDEQSKLIVGDLTPGILQTLFEGCDGPPVKTQLDEVRAVRQLLQARIDNSPNKAQTLAQILLPFAGTSQRREELLRRLKKQDTKYDDLQTEFDRLFEDALAEQTSAGKRDPDQHRQIIASLLFKLAEGQPDAQSSTPSPGTPVPSRFDTKAYQRAIVVTGLMSVSDVLDKQAADLRRLAEDVDADSKTARGRYVGEYKLVMEELLDRSLELEWEKLLLAEQLGLADTDDKLLETRRRDVERKMRELRVKQQATQTVLREQGQKEKEIFDLTEYKGRALRENAELVRRISYMELGPRP